MLPLGHVAYTWAALLALEGHGLPQTIDYRTAALAALLPDAVDKPLSLTVFAKSGTSQGLAHTLLVQALATWAVARLRPEWLPYALIANGHLVADQMWRYPRTLFFPLSRRLHSWTFMGTPAAMLGAYAEIIKRPAILAIELGGLGLLAWVARRRGLRAPGALWRLVRTGQADVDRGKRVPCG